MLSALESTHLPSTFGLVLIYALPLADNIADMYFKMNNEVHHYSTRISTKLHVSKVKHSFAKRCI